MPNTKKQVKRKLHIYDYVFEIDGKDIYDVYIEYHLNNIETVFYEKDKRVNTMIEPSISIELSGKDKGSKEAWICFEIKTDIDYLNTLSKEPTDITNILSQSECFIKRPNENSVPFWFELPRNTEEDIYKKITSLWVSKIKDNEFIFKLTVPNEVFTFFKIIFENE